MVFVNESAQSNADLDPKRSVACSVVLNYNDQCLPLLHFINLSLYPMAHSPLHAHTWALLVCVCLMVACNFKDPLDSMVITPSDASQDAVEDVTDESDSSDSQPDNAPAPPDCSPENPTPEDTLGLSFATVGSASEPYFKEDRGRLCLGVQSGDIWDARDSALFVHRKQVEGDFDVTATVLSFESEDPYAKVGVMVRPSTESNSMMGMMSLTHGSADITQQSRFFFRPNTSGIVQYNQPRDAPGRPTQLRLVRRGAWLIGLSRLQDESEWTRMGQIELGDLPSAVDVGIALSSHYTEGEQTERVTKDARVQLDDVSFASPMPAMCDLATTEVTCPDKGLGIDEAARGGLSVGAFEQAPVYRVTSSADSGDGTLRAILEESEVEGYRVIEINAGLAPIELESPLSVSKAWIKGNGVTLESPTDRACTSREACDWVPYAFRPKGEVIIEGFRIQRFATAIRPDNSAEGSGLWVHHNTIGPLNLSSIFQANEPGELRQWTISYNRFLPFEHGTGRAISLRDVEPSTGPPQSWASIHHNLFNPCHQDLWMDMNINTLMYNNHVRHAPASIARFGSGHVVSMNNNYGVGAQNAYVSETTPASVKSLGDALTCLSSIDAKAPTSIEDTVLCGTMRGDMFDPEAFTPESVLQAAYDPMLEYLSEGGFQVTNPIELHNFYTDRFDVFINAYYGAGAPGHDVQGLASCLENN